MTYVLRILTPIYSFSAARRMLTSLKVIVSFIFFLASNVEVALHTYYEIISPTLSH